MTAEVVPLPSGDAQPLTLARRAQAAIKAIYDERHERDGLNQADIADIIGRPQSYVSRVISGTKRHFEMDDVERFMRAFGISLDDLLERGRRELEKARQAAPGTPEFPPVTGADMVPCPGYNAVVLPFARRPRKSPTWPNSVPLVG